jgi:predicted amidohydrolase YtcJ
MTPVGKTQDGKIQVFVAKKIVTMDPGWPEATAVAVKDGRILSVGSFDDLKPWLDRFPYEVDRRFEDKVIYPGFVEAHTHPVMGGVALSLPPLTYYPLRNPYGPDFPGVKNKDEMLAKLKEYVAGAKSSDETILTWGYDSVAMGGNTPTKADLDKISATNPVILWDVSEHFIFTNSAAIKKYGITKDAVAKTVGAGRDANGDSNGQFLGTEAAKLIMLKPLAEILSPERGLYSLRYISALMQQAGITTAGDLFYGGVNINLEDSLVKTVFGSDSAKARIVHVADGATFVGLYGEQAIQRAIDLRKGGNENIMFNGVKFYADDAFLSLGMQLEWPGYINADQYKGLFMYNSKEDFLKAMRPWWRSGFQIHVHSNGSGGNQITLDALEALQAEYPRFNHRFAFEHFGISTTAQGRQVKALGALVSTNPYYVSERADINANQIGTDRASLASRMASLVNQDVVVALHSDTPVGVPSPLLEVWIAVNRIGNLSGKVHAPYERVLDTYKAMKMVTVDAAYALGIEDRVGSIETGKLADFVVLDADPQAVDPLKIKDIGVVATILGGKPTFTNATRQQDWK